MLLLLTIEKYFDRPSDRTDFFKIDGQNELFIGF